MTLQRFAIPNPPSTLLRAVVCALVGVASGSVGRAPASEVISAIPGTAQPPVAPAMVVETIEAGTRGPGPAPHHGRAERCRGGQCAHGHCGHAGCRHGMCDVPGCPAHCPVRPASFGFYGTQWRTWPGQEVTQATHVEPAAPVMPPKSEVPSAAEESPVPGFELPAPEPEGTQAEPSDEPPAEPAPATAPAEPAILPEPEDRPKAEKPAVPAEDNLFDEATLRRSRHERLTVLRQDVLQQERLRREALRQHAQRIARPVFAAAAPAVATPPAAATLPAADVVGAAPLPQLERGQAEGEALKQAVHAEPAPRGLRDAAPQSAPGNPLR